MDGGGEVIKHSRGNGHVEFLGKGVRFLSGQ